MTDRLRVSTRTARSKGYARINNNPAFYAGMVFIQRMRAFSACTGSFAVSDEKLLIPAHTQSDIGFFGHNSPKMG